MWAVSCVMTGLWQKDIEISFFKEALKYFASPEQLFYHIADGYYAYIPKGVKSNGKTLQSRNALIGQFTEKWVKDILSRFAEDHGLKAVNGVICEEIGLSKKSAADLAFCTTDKQKQRAENIKIIFEVKMSIVSNYSYDSTDKAITWVGDYKTHTGNPSILRSDSMLKAIGKSINIRVSGINSNIIPIIVLGNSPITAHYINKVDFLKTAGVIQGFWSLNPNPANNEYIKASEQGGFITIESLQMLSELLDNILQTETTYFSSMLSKTTLGELIATSNKEESYDAKAEKFLQLLRQV